MTNPLRIAFADDFPLFREYLLNLFTGWNYAVVAAAVNGADLIRRLEKAEVLPDVCTLDLRMTELNGFDTAEAIRSRWPGIKLIAFSTAVKENMDMIRSCGMHGFVAKGEHPLKLKEAIERVCSRVQVYSKKSEQKKQGKTPKNTGKTPLFIKKNSC